jgi:hypothetical protein
MNVPDIIRIILNEIDKKQCFETIQACSRINRLWRGIVFQKKYFHRPYCVFGFIKSRKKYRDDFKKDLLQSLDNMALFPKLSGSHHNIARKLVHLVPKVSLKRHIDYDHKPIVICEAIKLLYKYHLNPDDIDIVSQLFLKEKPIFILLHREHQADLLNKIVWIFILINSYNIDISCDGVNALAADYKRHEKISYNAGLDGGPP